MGALRWDDVVNHHQAWRLVTCIWLHAGVVHLAANMLSLVFIGIRLEQQFVISSESIAPRSPKRAPEAPTEMLFLMNKEDSTLPPNPDNK